jgi:hypothetical protein
VTPSVTECAGACIISRFQGRSLSRWHTVISHDIRSSPHSTSQFASQSAQPTLRGSAVVRETVPIGTAWTGIGAAGSALVGIGFFGERGSERHVSDIFIPCLTCSGSTNYSLPFGWIWRAPNTSLDFRHCLGCIAMSLSVESLRNNSSLAVRLDNLEEFSVQERGVDA